MNKKETVYVIQDSFNYGDSADAFPVTIVTSFEKAQQEAYARAEEAKQEIVNEEYATENLLEIKKISPLELGIFHVEEGLLEKISIFRQKLQANQK